MGVNVGGASLVRFFSSLSVQIENPYRCVYDRDNHRVRPSCWFVLISCQKDECVVSETRA